MSEAVYLVTNDGLGGCLMAAQVAFVLRQYGKESIIQCPARDEVFKPLKYLLEDNFKVMQAPEGYNVLHAPEDQCYVVYPDGLYLNPLAFDYRKYNTNPQAIKSIRVLTHKYKPQGKQIYVGLISSTEGYLYQDIPKLLTILAGRLPDYTIHYPTLSNWAGINLKRGGLLNLPSNVIIYEDDDFINQINIMSQCEYGIYTDNGPSHISYHLGQNRLLLDPRFGYGRSSLMWRARWRQTDDDSIRIESLPEDIADLVAINLKTPQTTLLPKQVVLNNKHEDWSRELLFKFQT